MPSRPLASGLALAGALVVAFGLWMTPAQAAPPVEGRPAEVPLSIEAPVAPEPSPAVTDDRSSASDSVAVGHDKVDLSEKTGVRAGADATTEDAPEDAPEGPPSPRLDPRAVPIQVAVGLGPSAPGSRDELALVDAIEGAAANSSSPPTSVRRLQGGAGEARSVCRQRRDDLVITVDYVADRDEPVILAYDCALERSLGARAATAAGEAGLVGALWSEHEELLRSGVKERRAPLLSRRTRRIVIAGGAVAVLGVALGVILASTLRPTTVVLTVGQ